MGESVFDVLCNGPCGSVGVTFETCQGIGDVDAV